MSIPRTKDYPSALFDALKEPFSIAKGGLFFLDAESGAYAPKALSGFDETSSRRLRLPPSLLEGISGDEPSVLSGESLSPIKMFFSNREFRALGSLRIFPLPLRYGKKVFLLCADGTAAATPEFPARWRILAQKAAEGLSDYAFRFLAASSSASAEPYRDTAREAFASALETTRNRGLKAIFLVAPLGPLVDAVRSKTPQAERESVLADARSALARMFPATGSVLSLSGDRVGILLASQSAPDADLILHQVSRSLGRILLGSDSFPIQADRVVDPSSADFRLEEFLGSERKGA